MVNFASFCKIKPTISLTDFTQEEKRNVWLQDHESILIRQHCQQLVEEVEKYGERQNSTDDGDDDKDTDTIRGLERLMKSETRQWGAYRIIALEEVLWEQEEQYSQGYHDDEAIAAVYSSVTSECQVRAELIAVQDRKEVETYLSDVM